MINRISTAAALAPLLLLAVTAPASAQCVAPGFVGKWHGDDGGTYVISQTGGSFTWTGRSGDNGKSWVNRFKGRFIKSKTISGEWYDTGKPWGKGTLTIRMANDWTLERIGSTGSPFGGTRWTRPRPPRGCPDTR